MHRQSHSTASHAVYPVFGQDLIATYIDNEMDKIGLTQKASSGKRLWQCAKQRR